MTPPKTRLDQLLVDRGLAETRERAQRLIRAGLVWLGEPPRDIRADKPGVKVVPDAVLEVRGADCPYVSRGGLKLAGALSTFGLTHLAEKTGLDIGASTGGFTDCLLQHGCARVFAFDSGSNQLHEKIKADPRVTWREQANARELTPQWVDNRPIDIAVIDVSFISLRLILPALPPLLAPAASVIALVKPQFEAGPADVGRGGVVRDREVHRRVLHDLAVWCLANGWSLPAMCVSPLRGPAGNIEFFFHLARGGTSIPSSELDNHIEALLAAAYTPAEPEPHA